MKRRLFFLAILFFLRFNAVLAQDSLLAILQSGIPHVREKTIATFKSSRLINAQTNETTPRRCLDFRITHRFGNFLDYQDNNNGGIHTFFGLDGAPP